MGGMTVDSSHPDSDRESFVSRVGSYALTDVGVGTSEMVGVEGCCARVCASLCT